MDGPRVAALTIYPIKGCGGQAVERCRVTPIGLAGDRTFMVVSAEGHARTQRRAPRLATVRPSFTDGGLLLMGPDRDPLVVEPRPDGPRLGVTIFGQEHPAIDQGDAAAEWFSTLLGTASRLVGLAPEHRRTTDGVVPGLTGWADSGAVVLLSRAAADDLSDRVVERTGEPVPLDRFRANVLLTGCSAYAEDDFGRVDVGSAGLVFAKQAVRCKVVTVDQEEGRVDRTEPLDTLATYRRTDAGVVFGAKYTVVAPGEIAVGDTLRTT